MIYGLLKQTLLPPVCLIIFALGGLLVAKRRGDAGWWGAVVAFCLLYALSTPFLADTLLSSLEIFPPLDAVTIAASGAQAIVVLSAESDIAPEYGGPSVGPLTLVRLRYGAHLHALTHLPVLVTGGCWGQQTTSMGQQMKALLEREHGISGVWEEGASATTHENATFSAPILRAKGVRRILLVTHAWHMRRARMEFMRAGLAVVTAPTAFTGRGDADVADFLPSAKAVMKSYYAFYEMSGWLVYRLRAGWAGDGSAADQVEGLPGAGLKTVPVSTQ